MAAMQLTRTHRILIGVVVTGAVIIAAIGFAGSYAAVRELAEEKGFGRFSLVFPIGIDAGICVLLALDLLLTWIRIPFPLLRQSAWILTAATIAFNGAAAWPDPLGVGMHAVIPLLFIVSVEAARHAVGRIADITADKHMEGVRLTRWLLSPVPTFKLWRRMKLWELRSYEQVIKLEQDRLIYQSRLQARFGRNWRRRAPVEALMPLRLAKYGVPLADTAPAGLAAAGIDPAPLAAAPVLAELPAGQDATPDPAEQRTPAQAPARPEAQPQPQPQAQIPAQPQIPAQRTGEQTQATEPVQTTGPQQTDQPAAAVSPWFAAPQVPEGAYEGAYNPTYVEGLEPTPVMIPSGPGRSRPLGGVGQGPQQAPPYAESGQGPEGRTGPGSDIADLADMAVAGDALGQDQPEDLPVPGLPDDLSREEAYFNAFRKYVSEHGDFPNARQFGLYLMDLYGITGRTGGPLSESSLRTYLRDFRYRYQSELDAEHIA
ncbi:DUF2637 domain-containing protein [Streptomyces sp. AK02-01A]|uniref:DUF2637 domain-containing protein n=1 Tax=Streptomyces sp. AK02-01A TaxID=3028648 RepID=UPI0029A0E257|nr:DUF2637 domain-containing protein [Streptomyces sp. AK02-01A]MDX3851089.1 DUF2637 domain-containing protein [Streptomyces sp. AK02-01A]